jgi:hypothetical protein
MAALGATDLHLDASTSFKRKGNSGINEEGDRRIPRINA